MNQNELARRHDLHLPRKFWHVGAGLSAILAYYYIDAIDTNTAVTISFLIGAVGFSVDFIRLRNPRINALVMSKMKLIARQSEFNGYSGLPFFALGSSLSLLLFPPRMAELSIFFLVFADPIASIVGIRYGKHKLFGSKSFEGFVAALVTCFIVSLVFCAFLKPVDIWTIMFCLSGGLVGSVAELVSIKIDDNFSIPVVSGFGLTFLNFFFEVFPVS